MDEKEKISDQKLLYDPMFAQKPVLDWTDSKKGGIFGKSIVKKTLFIIVLLIAIGGALFFSFNSISKNIYEYEPLDNGTYMLTSFSGQKNNTVLSIDYVRNDASQPDTSKPVTAVKKYTATGNDTLQFIFIGKDVSDIEETAFFYCSALNAVYVDEANEYYTDIDGILYRKENGVPVEAVFCPQQHTRYMITLAGGDSVPKDEKSAAKLAEKFVDEDYIEKMDLAMTDELNVAGKIIEIPDTVTKIDQLCFAYCDAVTSFKLPSALKEIETMAFFKCSSVTDFDLPDSLEIIGSDAFSKCSSLTSIFIPGNVKFIGHHAFWDCGNIEKVYMQADSLDGIETESHWRPQYRKTLMKNRDIVFSAERGVK